MRQVILYQDQDNAWIAERPSLPGCFSDGETQDEAIQLYIESLEARGLSLEEFIELLD